MLADNIAHEKDWRKLQLQNVFHIWFYCFFHLFISFFKNIYQINSITVYFLLCNLMFNILTFVKFALELSFDGIISQLLIVQIFLICCVDYFFNLFNSFFLNICSKVMLQNVIYWFNFTIKNNKSLSPIL
jgi:hypothetical protein